jgi:hypothetical protein
MEKERILVRDNKGIFVKMCRRKFKDEFEFSEDSFLLENGNKPDDFDRSIFVVYNKSELTDFFKLDIKGSSIMICVFDKQLYDSLSFFAEMKKIIIIDASKTKMEIFKDLDLYFNHKADAEIKLQETSLSYRRIRQMQFEKFREALFL